MAQQHSRADSSARCVDTVQSLVTMKSRRMLFMINLQSHLTVTVDVDCTVTVLRWIQFDADENSEMSCLVRVHVPNAARRSMHRCVGMSVTKQKQIMFAKNGTTGRYPHAHRRREHLWQVSSAGPSPFSCL